MVAAAVAHLPMVAPVFQQARVMVAMVFLPQFLDLL
jgi:hypothetical protein